MSKRIRENIPANAGPEFFRERILSRTDRAGECWLWTRPINSNGYAYIRTGGGKRAQAHRLSYEVFVGPIPDGLVIDHLCRVRHCVNPRHLEPVTQRENVMRGEHRIAVATRTGLCMNGHARTPDNVHRTHCRTCSRAKKRAKTSGVIGHPNARLSPAQRFEIKVDRTGECHRWTGSSSGTFWFQGKVREARRVSLLLAGIDVPEGAMIRHVDGCRYGDCVRPEHLAVFAVRKASGSRSSRSE